MKESMKAFAGKVLTHASEKAQKEKGARCPLLYYQPMRPSKQENPNK